ncbi:MAG: hypothetical protein AB1426_12775 [Bacillota bacterium]
MEDIRVRKVVETDGEICITGLPFKKGQTIEMTLKPIKEKQNAKPVLTAQKLLRSGLPGIWADRKDIGDSSVYARRLREQAQKRKRL